MDDDLASGIERAVFGTIGRDNIDGWLSRHLRTRLGIDLSRVDFRSGRIAAVYGAALSDGRQVAVKVHRRPADLAYLSAATACQPHWDSLTAAPEPVLVGLSAGSFTQGSTAGWTTPSDSTYRYGSRDVDIAFSFV
jgi:hypothetical protein